MKKISSFINVLLALLMLFGACSCNNGFQSNSNKVSFARYSFLLDDSIKYVKQDIYNDVECCFLNDANDQSIIFFFPADKGEFDNNDFDFWPFFNVIDTLYGNVFNYSSVNKKPKDKKEYSVSYSNNNRLVLYFWLNRDNKKAIITYTGNESAVMSIIDSLEHDSDQDKSKYRHDTISGFIKTDSFGFLLKNNWKIENNNNESNITITNGADKINFSNMNDKTSVIFNLEKSNYFKSWNINFNDTNFLTYLNLNGKTKSIKLVSELDKRLLVSIDTDTYPLSDDIIHIISTTFIDKYVSIKPEIKIDDALRNIFDFIELKNVKTDNDQWYSDSCINMEYLVPPGFELDYKTRGLDNIIASYTHKSTKLFILTYISSIKRNYKNIDNFLNETINSYSSMFEEDFANLTPVDIGTKKMLWTGIDTVNFYFDISNDDSAIFYLFTNIDKESISKVIQSLVVK